MLTRNKLIILVLFVLICFSILFYFKTNGNKEKNSIISKYQDALILTAAANKLQRIWIEGDIKNIWSNNCEESLGKKKNTSEYYTRCNPSFLQCYFDHLEFIKVEHEGEEFQLIPERVNNKVYTYDKLEKSIQVNLKHKSNSDLSLNVVLQDACLETYLPQRVYTHTSFENNEISYWKWDNFNRHIFVDKFLVTNRDVLDWIDFDDQSNLSGSKKNNLRKSIKSAPVTTLTVDKMKKYCEFFGKKILSSYVFDAATFHPGDYDNISPSGFITSYLPWTDRYKESFLYKSKNDDYQLTKKDCDLIFTKDCTFKYMMELYSRKSSSWIGIFQVMGGFPQYLEPGIYQNENIFLSSKYFDNNSDWHRLGRRSSWSGKGFQDKDFLKDIMPSNIDEMGVGFRCMRTVSVEK
ncbi:MAG: hypothetical protein HOJ35_10560 [Bdellovibrionales bacterium]|nr:hypothetical protein [Bdellovibrionales bacterium]